jgi:hypothetical protein
VFSRVGQHFEVVLAEAYECKILSNPWLAASTAAKQSVAETTEPAGAAEVTRAPQDQPQEQCAQAAKPEAPENLTCFPQEKSTASTTDSVDKSMCESHSENQLDAAAALASLEQATEPGSAPTMSDVAAVQSSFVEAAPAESAPPAPSISTSDATFGEPLRAKFLAAANLVRHNHGVTIIKEPGDDAQLDSLVHEVILAYQVCVFKFRSELP